MDSTRQLLNRLDPVEGDEAFPAPVADPAWLLEVHGYDPLLEREFESWFTVANGRTGTRGSLEEGSEESAPAVYVAGVYGRREGGLPGPELVHGPPWIGLAMRAAGEVVDLDRGTVLEHRRILDLRQGILFRIWRQRLPSGIEVDFRSARFASLAQRELLALEAEAWSSGPPVWISDAIPLPAGTGAVESLEARIRDGRLAVTVRGRQGGTAWFALGHRQGDGRVRRVAGVARAVLGLPADGDAEAALARAEVTGMAGIRARHRAAWRERWEDADVVVDGDPDAQQTLRFALYHLISSGDPESDAVSVGARGLTGPGYNGHVFWDTEAFVLPFFVYTHPDTARALLSYRYRTLPAARAKAASLGYRGALYAWESADTGEETTPAYGVGPDGRLIPILTGLQEHHISADVAWAVWRYWQATGDEAFLTDKGAEIVLETARFWASRARRGRDGRYHIRRVIGPDEYHEGVDDNAFTNVLARWNLERGVEVAHLLRDRHPSRWRDLSQAIRLSSRELHRWSEVAQGLVDGFDPESLRYEEFSGFFSLEDVRAVDLAPRPFAADLVLGRDRVHRAQIVKQADVVMLAHMLPEVVRPEVAEANYRYYEPRTTHGSSLSPAVHAAVAARVGALDQALAYFRMAAAIDLDDRMGNAALGIHIATMGGLWQAAVMGFGGVRPDGEGLRVDPRLPAGWERLRFPVRWRGSRIQVEAEPDLVTISLDGPAQVAMGDSTPAVLQPGRYTSARGETGWARIERTEAS
jgi:trehalose/maltose hydrolase-like predicted phosphorylase